MNGNIKFLLCCVLLAAYRKGNAQEVRDNVMESRASDLEALAEKKDLNPEDDDFETVMELFRKHPLNLNTAGADDLRKFHVLGVLQVNHFLAYRNLLGPLISVYELQSVPGWDVETIRRILPYITVKHDESVYEAVKESWAGGEAAVLFRVSQVIEKSKGFEKPATPDAAYYQGSAQNMLLRYTYHYKQLLSYGFTGAKDAGEPFFRNAQRDGFDFYSWHFCLQNRGLIRTLAIGDFMVNLGQGLMQWQSFSITKGSQALAVKREADCIRPYHSTGEFNFHRGIGISLQKGRWETSAFISSQKISTNREADTLAGREDVFSSFQNSGYHRTAAEIADRNNNRQFSAGGNIRYNARHVTAGFNWIHYHFRFPLQKQNLPYNEFSLKGRNLEDYSLEYSYTGGNLHLFGELAADHGGKPAFLQGALISLDEHLDMAVLYRRISPAYRSLSGNAFTENSTPNNEEGLYAGFTMRPFAGARLDLYCDQYVFPWLKYNVDGPSAGRDLFVCFQFQPDKIWHIKTYYKSEKKLVNGDVLNQATHGLVQNTVRRWRIESECRISPILDFTSRMEFVRVGTSGSRESRGFLGTCSISLSRQRFSGNLAAGIFETDDYATRIYTYEPDLLYGFSLPAFYGGGLHYYINLHRDFRRRNAVTGKHVRLSAWIKWGQTFYPGSPSIGSGLDEIRGNRKSEFKGQILMQW